jgi:membrane associated rhomboid family serine protease
MFARLTPMVKNLLLITVVAYLIPSILGWQNINAFLGLWHISSPNFKPYQFFTYMFAHGGFMHLLFNMLGLIFLAPMLEQFWGPKKFLTFYLITGIGAGIFYEGVKYTQTIPMKDKVEQYVANPNPDAFAVFISKYGARYWNEDMDDFIDYYYENERSGRSQSISYVQQIYSAVVNVPMVGASGAIYGILMAFGMLFPNTQLMLLFPPIPIKAKYFVLILGGIAIYSEFSSKSGDNVAHLAHLGGMIFAFIMIRIWNKDRRNFY